MSDEARVSELILVDIQAPPRRLEQLLETLAASRHPINPQIYHARPDRELFTLVEFPAYTDWLPEIRTLLERGGFKRSELHATAMIEGIQPGARERIAKLKGSLQAAAVASS